MRLFSLLLLLGLQCLMPLQARQQPQSPEFIGLDELRPGMRGEVWTVFRGTEPEPFEVEFTGVIHNGLGPGKSLILCELTDKRVQKMGAVAGMSGSPLYIDGKLAGALSYQVQKFETVRYAGFTPVADLIEVGEKSQKSLGRLSASHSPSLKESRQTGDSGLKPLTPVFMLSGVSPRVVDWLRPHFAQLGLQVGALGGTATSVNDRANDGRPTNGSAPRTHPQNKKGLSPLNAGDAVAVALTTGDITLAATGTVSYVAGDRLIAFGHPMMSLGEVALPMARAEIVTILPSSENSVKIANTGELIGTINQDRLSAIAGAFGDAPPMLPIEITIEEMKSENSAPETNDDTLAQPVPPLGRSLKFHAVQHPQLTPLAIGIGAAQAAIGSNDAGLSQGARLVAEFHFAGEAPLRFETLLPGSQGSMQGIGELVRGINALMQNPYEPVFPTEVKLRLTPLAENPITTIETAQLSRSEIAPGEVLTLTLQWRNFQGEVGRELVRIPVSPEWLGRSLEIIIARGELLDQVTERQFIQTSTQLRSFSAFLDFVREGRNSEGLHIAVVENSRLFLDQATPTRELPGSLARIATRADSARYQNRQASAVLWETRILPDRLIPSAHRLSFKVVER
ncbi:hypothetical protein AXK12_08085 [Cephaloticoccus capnophilus]|uniref:Peptidase S55 domain-containing protein n=1 Tax=Cephaloticoccus capnophilus TaxID=1548208 RepID=A0A139SHF6_9BACT|nr:SpoIVB peptidase S55 domain-containing protein [Cephaloticoccus capnophilus]KXU33987.1 hypothetical protein AXK12_08085 [Cephaloticoccus capnophilus]